MTDSGKQVPYKKISTYYMIGTLFNQGIAFLTVPIFTRLLSTFDYGIITTYNSWVAILLMVVSCAVYMGIRAAFIDYEGSIDDVMSSLTTFTLLNGVICTFIIFIIAKLTRFQYPEYMILFCMIQSIGGGLLQNYSMYLMMQYKYRQRTFFLVAPNLIAVVLSICVIAFFLKSELYLGRIIPTALTQGIFGLIVVILVYRKSKDIFDTKYIKYALTISLPLVLHGIALNILSQSDRLMITWLRNSSETGVYSLVYNFSMIATVITTALDGVWVPWFTIKLKQNATGDINDRVKDYIEIITLAMIGLILVGPEIVKILAREEYWGGINIIPPIVAANYAIFGYTLYVNVEHFYKKTIYITWNTIIAAVINIVTNYIFIPKYGYIAAAYTTLFSYLIAFVLHAKYAKKLNKELYPIRKFWIPLVKLSTSVILFYALLDYPLIRWIVAIMFCAIEAYWNRQQIREFLVKKT